MGYCVGCKVPRYYVGDTPNQKCKFCGGPVVHGESSKNKAKVLGPVLRLDIKLGIAWGGL
jgi:hypothetical protein